jgi:hypothetical protein
LITATGLRPDMEIILSKDFEFDRRYFIVVLAYWRHYILFQCVILRGNDVIFDKKNDNMQKLDVFISMMKHTLRINHLIVDERTNSERYKCALISI